MDASCRLALLSEMHMIKMLLLECADQRWHGLSNDNDRQKWKLRKVGFSKSISGVDVYDLLCMQLLSYLEGAYLCKCDVCSCMLISKPMIIR